MEDKEDVWTGMFTCKVCNIQYIDSTYTTRDGIVCNFGCRDKLRKQKKKKNMGERKLRRKND
tara:strand:+ start:9252 stop:9437 length:186 start_codon:yes stop_codon:yes gene_type:complete